MALLTLCSNFAYLKPSVVVVSHEKRARLSTYATLASYACENRLRVVDALSLLDDIGV